MNPTSRRAAIIAALTTAATTLNTTHANAYTTATDYDPNVSRALAIGATDAGWTEYSGPTTDNETATHNLQALERRLQHMLDNLLDAITTLRPTPTHTIRILCVGDSITYGFGSTDMQGYRRYLTDLLGRRSTAPTYTIQAYPGQTLRYVAPRAIAALPTANPDIVLIHLGTNDAAQNDLTDWQTRLGDLLDQTLASSPTIRICVARISYVRDLTVAARQQQINTWIDAAVTARAGTGRIVTADLTPISARDTEDGIHPMNAAYSDMAHRWHNAIEEWLPA